jgi:uncharacterized protein YgbK (DUF1537 family)
MKALTMQGKMAGTASFPPLAPVTQTVVVSGSVSPTTQSADPPRIEEWLQPRAVDAVALAKGDVAGEGGRD